MVTSLFANLTHKLDNKRTRNLCLFCGCRLENFRSFDHSNAKQQFFSFNNPQKWNTITNDSWNDMGDEKRKRGGDRIYSITGGIEIKDESVNNFTSAAQGERYAIPSRWLNGQVREFHNNRAINLLWDTQSLHSCCITSSSS